MDSSHILKIFFESVEKIGFFNVPYGELAQALNMEQEFLHELFPDRSDFLKALHMEIEAALVRETEEDFSKMSLKDKLFDLLMQRIEALEPYRSGLSRFIQESESNPVELKLLPIIAAVTPLILKGMENLLLSLNPEAPKCTQKNKAIGLLIIYLLVLHTWAKDNTPDLSVTLHALDRYLNLFMENLEDSTMA